MAPRAIRGPGAGARGVALDSRRSLPLSPVDTAATAFPARRRQEPREIAVDFFEWSWPYDRLARPGARPAGARAEHRRFIAIRGARGPREDGPATGEPAGRPPPQASRLRDLTTARATTALWERGARRERAATGLRAEAAERAAPASRRDAAHDVDAIGRVKGERRPGGTAAPRGVCGARGASRRCSARGAGSPNSRAPARPPRQRGAPRGRAVRGGGPPDAAPPGRLPARDPSGSAPPRVVPGAPPGPLRTSLPRRTSPPPGHTSPLDLQPPPTPNGEARGAPGNPVAPPSPRSQRRAHANLARSAGLAAKIRG